VGKLTTSHRYNQIPLLRSSPGGFKGSWSYRTYPAAKVLFFTYRPNNEWYFLLFSHKNTNIPLLINSLAPQAHAK